ncbi:Aspartate-ammonia_ligase [Hexamita inflata]|uniref:Aspartate-ammonia_ligase n=1 Tax=Hexamita inflata TaxID=28002 RepID=A0ABP1K284_9EUKA
MATVYKELLSLRDTEEAITLIKRTFQDLLSESLGLLRVTAPLFVRNDTGVNDDLNGTERPVSFPIKADGMSKAVIVHSLAKWKRMALKKYDIAPGQGIFTDMNAIRADEDLDELHSLYVDQFDWEMTVENEWRNLDYLKEVVTKIYSVMYRTEKLVAKKYPVITPLLPKSIHFVHTEQLEEDYPALTPKERENAIAKKHGAVFIIGIGADLKSGTPHDRRASDYDDWSTPTQDGFKGLNGDIIVWNDITGASFELSSMGIRVDKDSLNHQLVLKGHESRKQLPFHSALLKDELPLSIGGGIGQSRLCMFYLRKAHIGQVQSSIWPDAMVKDCAEKGIVLL